MPDIETRLQIVIDDLKAKLYNATCFESQWHAGNESALSNAIGQLEKLFVPPNWYDLAADGWKIKAIKAYRQLDSNIRLKEAKAIVEAYMFGINVVNRGF